MVGGFDILGRIPGVELGPGVESPLGVGVLDFRPGVPALSRWWREKVDTKSMTGHSSGHQTDETLLSRSYQRHLFGLE